MGDSGLYNAAVNFEALEKRLREKFKVDELTLNEFRKICFEFREVGRKE